MTSSPSPPVTDHTGEFADISVGDPWYREIREGEAGSSLIIARTEAGRDYITNAIESGAIDTFSEAQFDALGDEFQALSRAMYDNGGSCPTTP